MPRIQAHLDAHAPDDVLMPVGNRPPGHADGDRAPLLFDLDGNVAEWARTDDGTLRPMNSSAVTFHDPQAAVQSPPPAAFVGLRVVMDAE
jgi:hypothetical protein